LFVGFANHPPRAGGPPAGAPRPPTATRPKSARFDWGDGETRLIVDFTAKSESKSVVALAHERLPDAEEADRMKAYWRERLSVLRSQLESP
jgi:hypothetical protein